MREIIIDTATKGDKLLAEMSVLNDRCGFTDYDCIIDSGADTFHVNVTKEQLKELDFVPFHELKLKYHAKLPVVNGENGKFVRTKVGTAVGEESVLEGILRCVKIGNLMIKRPKCTVCVLSSTGNNAKRDPIFLFPLLYVFKRNILINQLEHKIQSELEGNSVCFTYSSSGGGRVYSTVRDINVVAYENMLKVDNGKIIPEKDSFIELLLHGREEEEFI